MPNDTEYGYDLTEGLARVRVRFSTDGPHVTSFMVQLEAFDQGEWKPVRRCDDYHGRSHIDLLDRRGRVYDKTWLEVDRSTALTMALHDFRVNGKRYVIEFLKDSIDERND